MTARTKTAPKGAPEDAKPPCLKHDLKTVDLSQILS